MNFRIKNTQTRSVLFETSNADEAQAEFIKRHQGGMFPVSLTAEIGENWYGVFPEQGRLYPYWSLAVIADETGIPETKIEDLLRQQAGITQNLMY